MLLGSITALSAVLAAVLCLCVDGFSGLMWIWVLPLGFLGSFLVLGGMAFLILWMACKAVDLDKPQEEDSPFYRFLVGVYADAAAAIVGMRIRTRGMEQVPKTGRFLLVCNHLNDLDPVVLMSRFKHNQLAFISKRENRDMFLVGKVMHKTLCQMVNRENDREALKTILKCIEIIKEDKASIAVFPEGYTSRDHKFHHFRSGVFKIAQKTKVPIVVCTLTNTHKVFSNIKRLKPTAIDLHVVAVVRPEEFAGITTVELGERIHAMMAADLGDEYREENT